MSIIQVIGAVVSSGSGGGSPPNAYAGYGASPTEGYGTDITIYVENWNSNTIYWSVVGKDGPAADPNTDMTGTLSGSWNPGNGTTNNIVTTVNFVADETTEDTEYWGVNLGSSPGASDYYNGSAWSITDASVAPVPTYTLANGGSNTVNEGSNHTLNVGGTNVPGGTYYWTIETNSGDFATTSGEVTVTGGTGSVLGSFTVTPTADLTTEGAETFTVALRSGSISGAILATSQAANISDTSQGPTYSWGIYDTSGDEGDLLTFNVNTTNVVDGTVLYWNVVLVSTISSGDFASTSGNFVINSSGVGSFNIDLASDFLTEGSEPFTVQVRTVSNSGTVVLTSDSIIIGDTSAGNRAPIAYSFNGIGSYTRLDNLIYSNITNNLWSSTDTIYILQGDYPQPQVGWQWRYDSIDTWRNILSVTDNGGGYWALQVDLGGSGPAGTTSQLSNNKNAEWALGTTWTIEFWIKPDVVPGRNGAPNTAQRILSVNTDMNVQNNNGYNNLDVCFTQGIIAIANQYAGFDAPAEMVGVWSHVAISSAAGNVKGFINGVQVYNYGGLNVNFTQGAADLYIGLNGTRASPNVNAFGGLLTDIRISDTARYTSAFNPATALAPTRDSNTKLLLTPKQDSWFGSETVHNLGYNLQVTVDYPTPPIYTVDYVGPNNVDEGSGKAFAVGGTNIPDGTYYWTVTNGSDFGTANGEFEIASNSGSFTVTPTADETTEGAETFTVQIRSGSITGTILATSSAVTINDTSLPKVQLTSGTALGFNGVDNRHVIVADNLADWNLGDNWTIEWWQKIPIGVDGFLSVLCQDANVPTYSGIDVFINAGNICMFNGNFTVAESPATRGEWNHIAIQKNGTTLAAYINGVAQSVGGSHPGTIAPSSPLNVCIGSRTYDGGANFYGQLFNGQLANIRISNIARYSGTFTVPTTVVSDANTRLALDGSVGGGGMLTDETGRHNLTNNGASEDTIV